jgi:hypothetical protein
VHHRVMAGQRGVHLPQIGDVALDEAVVRVVPHRVEVRRVPRVAERVEHGHPYRPELGVAT